MSVPRISASSYSNTAPLIWSFLYGSRRGSAEVILDTAPARSAELLAQDRVDAALVPVIAYQSIPGARLISDVCVGAKRRVRSVCLVTRGLELSDVRSVALDTSSRTSVALIKIIFREFVGDEPVWRDERPDLEAMLAGSDAALLIGDPALAVSDRPDLRVYDMAELWHSYTGLGFVFAMWMTRRERVGVDLAAARDEGTAHIREIIANYGPQTGVDPAEMWTYLSENISYSADEQMMEGMRLFFDLAARHKLIPSVRSLDFI